MPMACIGLVGEAEKTLALTKRGRIPADTWFSDRGEGSGKDWANSASGRVTAPSAKEGGFNPGA